MVIQDNNKWYKGHIASWWNLKHRDLNYINEPFNNPDDLDKWRKLGFTQTVFTGDMYDMRNPAPDWYSGFEAYFKDWQNIGWSFYRMSPGTVLPNHSDLYKKYIQIYNLPSAEKVWRAVVFLEKWKSGHYLEVDGNPLTQWQAGDYIAWNSDVQHLAANIGTTDRYTLQITGHKF